MHFFIYRPINLFYLERNLKNLRKTIYDILIAKSDLLDQQKQTL